MRKREEVPTTDEAREAVTAFLRFNFSQVQIDRLVDSPVGEGEIVCQAAAEEVFEKILKEDVRLRGLLMSFSVSAICQISLIRDVLYKRRLSRLGIAA